MVNSSMTFAVLTVSDRCYRKETEDKSGPELIQLLKKHFPDAHILQTCVPDEIEEIQDKISYWVDHNGVNLILTTGGTGMSPRDVTPEAMEHLVDRRLPCLEHIIQSEGLKVTPLAMLSRPTCGIRKKTLILNFPGSAKAVKENFAAISSYLPTMLKSVQSMK
uniref:molybdopterin molybdotransferase n=1 Tax=Cacopsylla melanoneura TaxID=428564 RepID=A0A8D9DXX8_9HEMI